MQNAKSSHHTSMTSILLLLFSVATLTGCVDADGSKIFNRTTDNLHIYRAGDSINYTVTGTRSAAGGSVLSSVSGTLLIEWRTYDSAPLIDPITNLPPVDDPDSNTTVAILEERSTLTIGSATTETRRLISQDQITGTVYLHALAQTQANTTNLYWVDNKITTPPGSLNRIKLLDMPLVQGNAYSVAYHVFENCEEVIPCDSRLGMVTEDHKVQDNHTEVETRAGIFDAFQLRVLPGFLSTVPGNAFPVPVNLDSSCSTTSATYDSSYFIFPEVGIVYMTLSCAGADAGFTYFIEYDHASGTISLPNKT